MQEPILQHAEHHESVLLGEQFRDRARSVLMEPTIPKTCFAIATELGLGVDHPETIIEYARRLRFNVARAVAGNRLPDVRSGFL